MRPGTVGPPVELALSAADCCAAFRMPMRRALGVPMMGDGIAPPGLPGGGREPLACQQPLLAANV